MTAPRVALALCLALSMAACGGGSSAKDLGAPDFGWVDTAMPDYGDVPGVDIGRIDLGPDAEGEDAEPEDTAGTDLAGTDLAGTDLAGTDLTGIDLAGIDPVQDAAEPDVPDLSGSCGAPVDVWGGKAIGKELPTASLDYATHTGAATAATAPSCGTADARGEAVYRLVLDGPVYVITNVESQVGDMTPFISYVKDSCAGSEADCTASDDNGRMAELATALSAGTWYVLVRLAPQAGGDPVGVEVDVSFDFEPGEVCNDGLDNNSDGDTDCDDPTCFTDPACSGGAGGEDCLDPFLVFGGTPPVGGQEFFGNGTLGGRRDDYNAPAPCWPGSAGSPDAVWRVVLDQPMTLEMAVAFYDGTFGQAYVLDQACTALQSCVPATFTGDPNLLVTLPEGTWHIVVDHGDTVPADPNFELAIFFDEP
jgi:hypothetical protein